MKVNEGSKKKKTAALFVLDDIEFSYYDSQIKEWKHYPIDVEKYAKFYWMVASDKSLEMPDEIKNEFTPANLATLNLNIHDELKISLQTRKVFSRIEFIKEGNYYRINLREQNSIDAWAYFYHPGIYREVIELFLSKL